MGVEVVVANDLHHRMETWSLWNLVSIFFSSYMVLYTLEYALQISSFEYENVIYESFSAVLWPTFVLNARVVQRGGIEGI